MGSELFLIKEQRKPFLEKESLPAEGAVSTENGNKEFRVWCKLRGKPYFERSDSNFERNAMWEKTLAKAKVR